jgi:hypothetical protein
MAESMTMNRVIHGAVRRDLERLLNGLSAFRDGDRQRAAQLATGWRFFRGELDYHHRSEHAIAWPALRAVGVDDVLLAQMDAEHDKLAAALGAAGARMGALETAATRAAADEAHAAVATLTEVAEEHLSHEERDVDPVYAAKRGTPEMKAMARRFARDRNPLRAGDFFAWVENGASAAERAGVRTEVPGPVVTVFSRVLGRRYRTGVARVWR